MMSWTISHVYDNVRTLQPNQRTIRMIIGSFLARREKQFPYQCRPPNRVYDIYEAAFGGFRPLTPQLASPFV